MTPAAAVLIAPDAVSAPDTITVRMGDLAVVRGPDRLRTVGLGSCVAIVIFAPAQQLVALAHCMLPTCEDAATATDGAARFTDAAVPALITALEAEGGTAPYSAALVGGASMFPGVPSDFVRDIAAGNVRGARAALDAAAIPVRLEDVGGTVGRSIVVDPVGQRVLVHTIRGGDRWL